MLWTVWLKKMGPAVQLMPSSRRVPVVLSLSHRYVSCVFVYVYVSPNAAATLFDVCVVCTRTCVCVYVYLFFSDRGKQLLTGALGHPGEQPTVCHPDRYPRYYAHQRQCVTVKQTEFSHTNHPGKSTNPSGSSIFLYM